LYLQYDNVRCNTTYGQAAISGDHADLPVTLRIRYSARGSGAPSSTNLPLLAKLVRHGEKWQIDQLLPRT
jgi:hypothetical protein